MSDLVILRGNQSFYDALVDAANVDHADASSVYCALQREFGGRLVDLRTYSDPYIIEAGAYLDEVWVFHRVPRKP